MAKIINRREGELEVILGLNQNNYLTKESIYYKI